MNKLKIDYQKAIRNGYKGSYEDFKKLKIQYFEAMLNEIKKIEK